MSRERDMENTSLTSRYIKEKGSLLTKEVISHVHISKKVFLLQLWRPYSMHAVKLVSLKPNLPIDYRQNICPLHAGKQILLVLSHFVDMLKWPDFT